MVIIKYLIYLNYSLFMLVIYVGSLTPLSHVIDPKIQLKYGKHIIQRGSIIKACIWNSSNCTIEDGRNFILTSNEMKGMVRILILFCHD